MIRSMLPLLALLVLLASPPLLWAQSQNTPATAPAPAQAQAQASGEVVAPDEPPPADLGRFVNEIMRVQLQGDASQILLWFPQEFLVESSFAETGQSRAAARKELTFLDPYLLTVVRCSVTQPDGREKYASEEDVRARASIVLPGGERVRPLEAEDVPPLVAAASAAMRTMMASEGDAGGRNMHVLIFPNGREGRAVDSSLKQKLTMRLDEAGQYPAFEATWHTPFETLTPPVTCSRCGEGVAAKYNFCPWCGNALAPSPAGRAADDGRE